MTAWNKKELDKDVVYDLYITQNLSKTEVEEKLNLGKGSLSAILKRLGIVKSKELHKECRARRNKEKYGVENPFQLDSVKEKSKQTLLEKYGVEHPLQNNTIQKKARQTTLERFGVEYSTQSKEVRDKAIKTNLEKYGTKHPGQSDIVKDKRRQTNLERYGHSCALQNEEVRAKSIATQKSKYGYEHNKQAHYPEGTVEILFNKDKLAKFIDNQEDKTAHNIATLLGCGISTLLKHCREYEIWGKLTHYTSSYEIEIREIFAELGIELKPTRDIVPPYEIDLYNDDYKIGIEFNGNFWHSIEVRDEPKYHQNKSLLAEEKGVFIYHIFEYEWEIPELKEKIIAQLKNLFGLNQQKIFARNTELREVSRREGQDFLKANHLQGRDSSSVKLGLYYNNELVSLMTFCKPRFNKNYEWELSRFCNKRGTNVVGGASKLFKAFLENHNGDIISYSNIAKGRGTLYEKLGFELSHISPPNYVWYDKVNHIAKPRYQCQMKNEKQIMISSGHWQIYDCGNKVWVYKNLK